MNNKEWIAYNIRSIGQTVAVQKVKIDELVPFPNHPFKVQDDDDMKQLVESISENGVLTPITVRYDEDTDIYQLISGHRRTHAARLAGLTEIPAIVKHMSEEEAVIMMVDSNLQREHILFSEKAFAYKMKLEAMKRQGKRTDLTSTQPVSKLRSNEELGQEVNESRETIRRYIRLTELIPELLELVDKGKIGFTPAVELSYLTADQQKRLMTAVNDLEKYPNGRIAARLRELSKTNAFEQRNIRMLLKGKNLAEEDVQRKPIGRIIDDLTDTDNSLKNETDRFNLNIHQLLEPSEHSDDDEPIQLYITEEKPDSPGIPTGIWRNGAFTPIGDDLEELTAEDLRGIAPTILAELTALVRGAARLPDADESLIDTATILIAKLKTSLGIDN